MDAIKLLTDRHRKFESALKTGLDAQQPQARAAALVQVGEASASAAKPCAAEANE